MSDEDDLRSLAFFARLVLPPSLFAMLVGAAAGVVGLALNVVVTVEWSLPYCSSDMDNGPAMPAYGFPFPWIEPSMASSMTYLVMWSALIANVLVWAVPGAVAGWLAPAPSRHLFAAVAMAFVAVPVALLVGVIFVFEVVVFDAMRGVERIGGDDRRQGYSDVYADYRPIRVVDGYRYSWECRPSPYWFE